MSSYNVTLTNNGSGVFTPLIRRAGTAASGGTVLTLPTAALPAGGSTTTLMYLAFDACKRRALNYRSANPTVTYNIDIVDSGAGVFTPTIRAGGTPASGGTVLTNPPGDLFPGTTTPLLGLAADLCKRRALNDRSAGN